MPRTPQKDIFYRRTAILTVFLLLFALLLVVRLASLQIIRGKASRALAEQQHSIYRKLLPSRGEIKIVDKVTNQTEAVATNAKKYLVYAVPQEIQNINLASESLAGVLGLKSQDIYDKIKASETKKYVPLKKQLTEEEQEKIKALKLPGIYFDSEDSRLYPEQSLLSHVLGFVGYNKDSQRVGLYGLERSFEKDLAGTVGGLSEEKDIAGAWIFGSKRDLTPAQDGVNLVLTIDKSIQFKAENVLKEAVTKNEADSGSVIVANPKTGAILAMAGYPDFNPNEYNKVENPAIYTNEATMGNYEPGSVFKPLTMAMAIDKEKVTAESTYTDTGSVEITGYTIKNSDLKAHGLQTMTQVLEQSLNTGAIYAKEQIGNSEFFKYVKKFGFGQKTGIELPEGQGNLDNLKANILVNYDTASFGQGISVTPIQLIQAFTALANGGKMMKPYIVQSKIYSDGKAVNTQPQVVSEVVSAKTANTVSAMMVSVVENGHGKKAGVPGYYIAGKTGTAQVPRKDGRGYEENNNIGSFIGYGPVEDPQFVMLVRINHPRDVVFAETSAAPAFGEIAQYILNYMHIAPTRK